MNIILKRSQRDKMSRNNQSHQAMSSKTKDFLQKICYKRTASIDMTQYGFINDSKVNPVNLLMKPLREQLEKICGSNSKPVPKKGTPKKRSNKENNKKPVPKKGTPLKRNDKGYKRVPKKLSLLKQVKLKNKDVKKNVEKVTSKLLHKKRFPLLRRHNNSPTLK